MLRFPKKNLGDPQELWNSVLWAMFYGSLYIWQKPNSLFHLNLIPTAKHCGGSVIVWGCFVRLGHIGDALSGLAHIGNALSGLGHIGDALSGLGHIANIEGAILLCIGKFYRRIAGHLSVN